MAQEVKAGRKYQLPAGQAGGMENLVSCSQCKLVYDVRYLSESCRYDEESGYRCLSCNSIL